MEYITTLFVLLCFICNALGQTGDGSEEHPFEYFILEELDANTPIGDVAIDAKLEEKYDASTMKKLRFSFLNQDGERQRLFSIDETSGIVQTAVRIDRDVLCPHQITCLVNLDVAIQPAEYFQVVKILLDILDINDHKPIFPKLELTQRVSEAALIGTSFTIPTATDPDSASYAVQSYELVSSSDKFELKETNSIEGETELKVILKEKLDREETDFYRLQVVAHDGGNPILSGTMVIKLHVEDANDNDPKFANATYEVFVMENVNAGTTIAKVKAEDKDAGANGQITYAFTERTDTNYGQLFGIVKSTGAIFLKEALDFEKGSTYLLVVTASDQGNDPRPAHTTVVVRVEDANDNAPQITINTLTKDGVAKISESSIPGTFVAHVSVSDLDGGDNGKLECTMTHERFTLQTLYSTQYKIVTNSSLDREKEPDYNVTVKCHDKGLTPKTVFKYIKVKVLDENDNQPIFTESVYEAHIQENNYVDDVVIQVRATDADEGQNANIRYELSPDAKELFKINPVNGVITANVIFDHEMIQKLEFQVVAADQGQPVLKGVTKISLTIMDLNDEPPSFTQKSFAFGTFENQPPHTAVGRVVAIDPDSGPNGKFEYKIDQPLSLSARTFDINSQTGSIVTRSVLDRERQNVYYLTVVATNRGIPPLSSSVSVTIYVADKNDNAPIIRHPTSINSTIYISSRVPVGHVVTQVEASDSDLSDNSKLSYAFNRGNDNNMFAINPSTGAITVQKDMSHIDHEQTDLQIIVQDHGFPQQSAFARIHVIVNRTIEYIPEDGVRYVQKSTAVIVSLSSVALLLFFLLILAILLLRRQGQKQKAQKYKYKNVAQKIVQAREDEYKEIIHAKESSSVSHLAPTSSNCTKGTSQKDNGICLNLDITGDEEHIQPPRYWCVPPPHRDIYTAQNQANRSRRKVEPDTESACSGQMSNCDSGHGSCGGDGDNASNHCTDLKCSPAAGSCDYSEENEINQKLSFTETAAHREVDC